MRAPAALLAIALALTALAGCVDSVSTQNFTLTSDAVGFDKGGNASFTLTYDPRALPETHTYTLDKKYAVEQIRYDRVGSFTSEFETDNARQDLDLRFFVNGTEVEEFVFGPENRSVELRLKVPDSLAVDTYILELRLFQVGALESNEFRVAEP